MGLDFDGWMDVRARFEDEDGCMDVWMFGCLDVWRDGQTDEQLTEPNDGTKD